MTRKDQGDSEKGPKKAGRPFLRDRKHLTPREEEYATLVAGGMTVEEAALQVGVTTKEAVGWHKNLAPMLPRISELRAENYQDLSEKVLSQHYKILLQLSEQIETKLEEGKKLTPQELKSIYTMHQEIGPVIAQHKFVKEEHAKAKVQSGEGIFIKMEDISLREMMNKVKDPAMVEYSIVSTVRWFKGLKKEHQRRFRGMIDG